MEQKKKNARMSSAVFATLLWLLPSVANADPHKLTCGKEKTIGEALHELKPGDTLLVSGICNENLLIAEEVHRITLDGQGTAVVNGPDATLDTIDVRGRGISIKGFNVTGGRDGIRFFRGGTGTIDGDSIQSTGRNGINVFRNSSASITNNTIQNVGTGIGVDNSSAASISNNTLKNLMDEAISVFAGSFASIGARNAPNVIQNIGVHGIRVNASSAVIAGNTITGVEFEGILVTENSSVRIGFGSLSDTQPSPNTIHGNGGTGIRVRSSEALIAGNDVSNNGGNGIQIERASHADIAGNIINGNGRDAIRAVENSTANLANTGGSASFFNAANTGENAGVGVNCSIGGYVSGRVGTLDGGVVSFDGTCINNTSP